MTKFKNLFLLAALAVSAVTFTSCDKEDETGTDTLVITATALDTKGVTVASVKAIGGNDVVIATGAYAGDGFTLTLPTPTAEQLTAGATPLPSKVTVTPDDAKAFSFSEIKAYEGEKVVGSFHCYKSVGSVLTAVAYYYLDKAATVNGTGITGDGATLKFENLFLPKGWSKVYQIQSGSTVEFTTAEQTDLAWGFDSNS